MIAATRTIVGPAGVSSQKDPPSAPVPTPHLRPSRSTPKRKRNHPKTSVDGHLSTRPTHDGKPHGHDDHSADHDAHGCGYEADLDDHDHGHGRAHDTGLADPHSCLGPLNVQLWHMADAPSDLDPENAVTHRTNAAASFEIATAMTDAQSTLADATNP